MGDRTTARPEPVWGVIRAALQGAAGVAFALEDMPRMALFLSLVAAATLVYETAGIWRRRRARRGSAGSPARVAATPSSRPARSAPGAHGRVPRRGGRPAEGRRPRLSRES